MRDGVGDRARTRRPRVSLLHADDSEGRLTVISIILTVSAISSQLPQSQDVMAV